VQRATRRLRAGELTTALKTDLETAARGFGSSMTKPPVVRAGWRASGILEFLKEYAPPTALLPEGDTVELDALWAIATQVAESSCWRYVLGLGWGWWPGATGCVRACV
jgi:hypothetical protein